MACLRLARAMARIIAAVTPFIFRIIPLSFFEGTASSIGAMPSARALLVASLLTEPPYGCLGPPGNDRYRKRSLRSQTGGGFASQLPKSRRLVCNKSATSRRVLAGAIEKSTAMSRTAFSRKSPQVPGVCWLGNWALGTSDRGGQGKSTAFRRAHVVDGVEVLRGDENRHAVAALRNLRQINVSGAVGL